MPRLNLHSEKAINGNLLGFRPAESRRQQMPLNAGTGTNGQTPLLQQPMGKARMQHIMCTLQTGPQVNAITFVHHPKVFVV